MPTYWAELEDGRTIELESDHEPTHQEIINALGAYEKAQTKQAPTAPPAAPVPESPDNALPQVGALKTIGQHFATGIAPGAAFVAGAEPGALVGSNIGT